MIPSAPDLEYRRQTISAEFQGKNPRRPRAHGWLAFEILRRAARESLAFESYAARPFDPDEDIQALAKTVPELVFVVSAAYLSNAPELVRSANTRFI